MTQRRLRTGSDDLDLVLGGGIPAGSLLIVAGAPGTGKTILAQQLCFANATPDRRALYYTTWSEPHDKLLRHLAPFAFFDEDKLGESIDVVHLADLVETADTDPLAEVAAEVVRASFTSRPSVIVIDSSKALHDVADERSFRRAVYDLGSRVGHTDTVLVLVGEYTAEEIEDGPEFAVADGILRLTNESTGAVDRRWLRVVKMRGSMPIAGKHSFTVSGRGFEVYPRFEALPQKAAARTGDRLSIGVDALDEMLGGGIPASDSTLVVGPSGVGKTVLALSFVSDGIAAGERSLYVSFQEDADQLVQKAGTFGLNIAGAVADGLLEILHIPPVELNLDAVGALIRDRLTASPVRRLVIDSLAELAVAAAAPERFPPYVWSLTGLSRATGTTALITHESATLPAVATPASDYSFLFQNALFLRYVDLGGTTARGLQVHKMRNSDHSKEFVRYQIGPAGIHLLEEK